MVRANVYFRKIIVACEVLEAIIKKASVFDNLVSILTACW